MKWEEQFKRKDKLDFNVGDEVKIGVRIKEGDKERIQNYEGTVIGRKGSGLNETFKVRKLSSGVGVERTFLLNSYAVSTLEVTRKGNVKRAKLYYIRDKVGKGSKIKEDILTASISDTAEPESAPANAAATNETK